MNDPTKIPPAAGMEQPPYSPTQPRRTPIAPETQREGSGGYWQQYPAKRLAEHWESVYPRKPAMEMSWYRPRSDRSLFWIERLLVGQPEAAIIDVGTAESTLADDLVKAGFPT